MKWRKIYQSLGGLNGVLLMLYLFAVLSIQVFIMQADSFQGGSFLGILLLILAVLPVVCPVLLRMSRGISVCRGEIPGTLGGRLKWLAVFFLLSFLCLLVWYVAYYPGSWYNDSVNQYGQVLTGAYKDWNPVLQTLFAIWLPLRLTGHMEAVVLFQIVEYSCVLAYMSYVVMKYGGRRTAFLILFYVLLNPITQMMVMNPIKDVSLAMAQILLTMYSVEVYFTKGQWMSRWRNIILFSLVMAAGTIFRYNSIFFTIPLLIAVFLYIGKKERIRILAFLLLFLIVVKGPLYAAVGVEKPDKRQVEAMGLPMTVIGNVVKEHPESLDEESKEFVYAIAPQGDWEWGYQCGNFNYIKWTGINLDVIDETDPLKILRIMWKCMAAEPLSAFHALFDLTDMVYGIDGELECVIMPSIVGNEFGITARGNAELQKMLQNYTELIFGSFTKYIFGYTGVMNLLVILLILGKMNLKSRRDWKKLLLGMPILFYNFGTMLLLTGDDFRFFYPSFTICPLIAFFLAVKEPEEPI